MRFSPATRLSKALTFILLAASVNACAAFHRSDKQYEGARQTAPLQLPPQLSAPQPNPDMDIPRLPRAGPRAAPPEGLDVPPEVALESNDITVVRDGSLRWLLVQAAPEDLWQRVRGFWSSRDVPLAYENAGLYVMETDRLTAASLQRAGPPGQSPALAGNATAGGVKLRLWLLQFPDEDGTELYLTAAGTGASPASGEGGPPRPSAAAGLADPVLKRLVSYLGGPSVDTTKLRGQAAGAQPGKLVTDQGQGEFLELDKPPEMAWRHVAYALNRLGYAVIGHVQGKKEEAKKARHERERHGKGPERHRSSARREGGGDEDKSYDRFEHTYLIKTSLPEIRAPKKKKGWFSWLFFGGPETPVNSPDFTVALAPAGRSSSRLTVGNDPAAGAGTEKDRKILQDIHDALN